VTLAALIDLSRRLARDPLLVQGAGGNTSVKLGDTLLVKASGKWLAEIEDASGFVPVALSRVRRAIAGAEPDPVSPYVLGESVSRPSIETTMHALLPQRVVVHLHSVNVIAWAARADGERALAAKLRDVRWSWVPYRKPGLPLTEAVRDALDAHPDVLVLANHGLVIGADDVESAERLLARVEEAVQCRPREAPAADLAVLARFAARTGLALAADSSVHGIATDPRAFAVASGAALYPDHVVFLAETPLVLSPDEAPERAMAKFERVYGQPPAYALVAGAGVLVDPALSRGGHAMLSCLARVLERIPIDAPVRTLEQRDIAELVTWDAEHYRRALA
jgi:rhamnose utilization protein RhaD (predicted bifunctional aldolase and dehydrogenase)